MYFRLLQYQYDANGNLVYVNTSREKQDQTTDDKANERKMLWDEENRLTAIDINGFISGYWYDASGERVIKTSGDDEGIYVNDVFSGGRTETANFTAYINPYLVVSKGGQYTKHIYIGSQRIVSKLGDLDSYGQDPRRIEYAGSGISNVVVDYSSKYKESQQTIKDNYDHFEVPYYGKDNDDYVNGGGFCCGDNPKLKSFDPAKNDNPELYQYYYHSDHLGSSSLITNLDGEIVQHIEYVPFGEVFIEERNNTWNTPYLFNAKELDEETGLYYYGARYYNPRTSVWLSTDPLQEKYPNISTYAYCFQNPVKYIDPTGMEGQEDGDPIIDPKNQDGRNPTHVINTTYKLSGGNSNFKRNFIKFTKGTYYKNEKIVGGVTNMPGYTSDSKNEASSTNSWVHDTGVFKMEDTPGYNTRDLANYLLGCMINGMGYENIEFPLNGAVSTQVSTSGITKDAIESWYLTNKGKSISELTSSVSEFSGNYHNGAAFCFKGMFHIETFIGSASITVTPMVEQKALLVTVFNITGLMSGDMGKHLPGNNYPLSIIRNTSLPQGHSRNKYASISQTFSFTTKLDFNLLK